MQNVVEMSQMSYQLLQTGTAFLEDPIDIAYLGSLSPFCTSILNQNNGLIV